MIDFLQDIEICFWISGKYSDMSAEFFGWIAERWCRAQVGSNQGGSVGGRLMRMSWNVIPFVLNPHYSMIVRLGDVILDDIRIKRTPAQKTNTYHCYYKDADGDP